jgi:hypothetical protein
MWISDDAYQAAFYAGSWVRCCCHAGLLRLDGYWLEMTEYLAACFAVKIQRLVPAFFLPSHLRDWLTILDGRWF